MKRFLLLVFSLMTGCEASSRDRTRTEVWAECDYPNKTLTYNRIEVAHPKRVAQLTESDAWENAGKFFMYDDKKDKELRVFFTQRKNNIKDYKCRFYQRKSSSPQTRNLEDDSDEKSCRDGDSRCPLLQTYRTADAILPCGDHGSSVQFFCKQTGSTCDNVLQERPSPLSNARFSLTNGGVSIRGVSSQDEGVYWCGLRSTRGKYREALRRIRLEVHEITVKEISSAVGQSLTLNCSDPTNAHNKTVLCKGEGQSACASVVSTSNRTSGRFSLNDENKRNVTITVRDVTAGDTGTYWCGAESSDLKTRRTFFTKLHLTVVSASEPSLTTSLTPSSPPVNSTVAELPDNSRTVVTSVVVFVVLLVLVLVVVLLWVYRRSDDASGGAAQVDRKEDHGYADIQDYPQKAESGTEMKMTYATVTFPTNPSAFAHGSTASLRNSPGGDKGDTYGTVTDAGHCSLYATVNLPPELPADAVYSTVTMPQL